MVVIFYVLEVSRQVHGGYFGGIMYLLHQAHCKKLYSVDYKEPSHAEHMVCSHHRGAVCHPIYYDVTRSTMNHPIP